MARRQSPRRSSRTGLSRPRAAATLRRPEVPMKTSRILGLAAAIVLVAAASPVRSAEPTLSTDDQKTVYAMGYSLAGSLDRFALSPEEIDILIVGLRDGTSGAAAKVPVDQFATKISSFGQTALGSGGAGGEEVGGRVPRQGSGRAGRHEEQLGSRQARHQGRQRRDAEGRRHRQGSLPRHLARRHRVRLVRRAQRARRVPARIA